ncbi:hypothetical protein [Saccharopolyspora sp. CA-218241]|uniref:hypothetical protein n=1 Tax=Saccharopolyspora sp. CA-218241 TaxID=3240027 RepID=UPI003D9837F2
MRRIWWIVLGVVVLLVVGLAAWAVPLLAQGRADVPARRLVVATPAAPGDWRVTSDELRAGPELTGLDERWSRVWERPDGADVQQAALRFSSPLWAARAFGGDDPAQQQAEFFDAVDELPVEPDTGADEAAVFCGREFARGDGCASWFVWLRYGQYVISLTADDLTADDDAPGDRLPGWLADTVAEADRAVTGALR